jgi:hypothetical protein
LKSASGTNVLTSSCFQGSPDFIWRAKRTRIHEREAKAVRERGITGPALGFRLDIAANMQRSGIFMMPASNENDESLHNTCIASGSLYCPGPDGEMKRPCNA